MCSDSGVQDEIRITLWSKTPCPTSHPISMARVSGRRWLGGNLGSLPQLLTREVWQSKKANPSSPAPQTMLCAKLGPWQGTKAPITLMDLVINVAAVPHSTRLSSFPLPGLQGPRRQQLP